MVGWIYISNNPAHTIGLASFGMAWFKKNPVEVLSILGFYFVKLHKHPLFPAAIFYTSDKGPICQVLAVSR